MVLLSYKNIIDISKSVIKLMKKSAMPRFVQTTTGDDPYHNIDRMSPALKKAAREYFRAKFNCH